HRYTSPASLVASATARTGSGNGAFGPISTHHRNGAIARGSNGESMRGRRRCRERSTVSAHQGGSPMLGFRNREETTVKASPEAVFAFVSDLTGHAELAGSGEVKSLRRVG